MNDDLEARIVKLEELAAHQGRLLEELSDELARSARDREALARRITRLDEAFADLADGAESPPVTRPPHY